MSSLEQEVARLRTNAAQMDEIATNWKKCALALAGPTIQSFAQNLENFPFGPGILFWVDALDPETSSSTHLI